VGEVHFYGPGYVTRECLEAGVSRYNEKHGPFDFVIVTSTSARLETITQDLLNSSFKFFERSFSFDFSKSEFETFFSQENDISKVCGVKKIAFLSTFDFHVLQDHQCSFLASNFDLVAGYNHQHTNFQKDFDSTALREEGRSNGKALDNWASLVREQRELIFPYLNYSLPTEFFFSTLQSRPNDWIVPGTRYIARRKALSVLREQGIAVSRTTKGLQIIKTAKACSRKLRTSNLLLKVQNQAFIAAIRSSKFGYTCGSAFDMPIRKIFEIPSSGALLAIKPFALPHALECIGLQHRKNCLMCHPEDLGYWAQWTQRNPEEAQQIARNGQRLILEKHTFECRVRQFREALKLIIDGSYGGAKWVDGELVVTELKRQSTKI